MNQAARESWPLFRQSGVAVRIVHQCGRTDHAEISAAFAECGIPGEVAAFIEDMPAAFAEADLVVCRSGAGAVSELAAAGKPSLLVPFPHAADQHQLRNAESLARAGAARLVADSGFTGQALFDAVVEMASHPERLESMGKAARALARPAAAARAADILEELANRRGRH